VISASLALLCKLARRPALPATSTANSLPDACDFRVTLGDEEKDRIECQTTIAVEATGCEPRTPAAPIRCGQPPCRTLQARATAFVVRVF
jgi:hypothetical protein